MFLSYMFTAGMILVAFVILVEQRKSYVLSRKSWDDVIAGLQPTPTGEIAAIALEYLNPGQKAFTTKASERFTNLGGLAGLKHMRSNSELLIALAAQAERWNPEVTRSLVTQMRRDGSELRRSTLLLSLRLLDARGRWGGLHIQQAAAAYYRMIYRLLDVARDFSPDHLRILNKVIWN